VNPDVLRAILKIEPSMRADAVTRNSYGSLDVGIAQTNSIHFQELARHQIAPAHLLDACVSTYVAAWQLSKIGVKHGDGLATA
jgi:hypothetical protein